MADTLATRAEEAMAAYRDTWAVTTEEWHHMTKLASAFATSECDRAVEDEIVLLLDKIVVVDGFSPGPLFNAGVNAAVETIRALLGERLTRLRASLQRAGGEGT